MMNRRNNMISLALLLCSVTIIAQNTIRVHYKDGIKQDIPISQVDSVTFIEKEEPEVDVSLTGSWLWGDEEAGYYELLTFNADNTYTGYDNYFTYGFDTMTYGWYVQHGTLLTLQSNGFGYNRRYTWFVMGLTENMLDVMTKMGPFTYYKLQTEEIRLHVGDSLESTNGDRFLFADGVIVAIVEGKLIGLAQGTTYILKHIAATNMTVAYKLTVI